ncbi:hypothetical protein F8R90_32180 [Nostoc sp. NZL]|nr:hypothetical protein [Nostoc sp. NZL]
MNQLSKEELVEIIIEQGKAICELQKTILELQQEVEQLKVSVANSDFCLFTAADTRSRAELETILGTKYT